MKFFATIFVLATAAFAAANPVNKGGALLEERQCIPNGGDCGNNPTGCCSSCCNFGRTGGFCQGMSPIEDYVLFGRAYSNYIDSLLNTSNARGLETAGAIE